jgi:hypothetical protein
MAGREYTIPLTASEFGDRASIFELEDGWYYCLRRVDPHGEEFLEENAGPFPTAAEAEQGAREDYIPHVDTQ